MQNPGSDAGVFVLEQALSAAHRRYPCCAQFNGNLRWYALTTQKKF
jgi:hypothetical protein